MSFFDEDEENPSYRQYDIRDGIIFLIEVNDSMYAPVKELDGQSQIFEILSSINQLTQELVKTGPSNGIGIFFYNTSKQHKGFNVKNVSRLFRLHELNLDDMQKLNNLIEDDVEQLTSIKQKFPPSGEQVVDVNEVLKFVLDEFRTDNTKSFNREKLLWFTNNDNPYNMDLDDTDNEIFVKMRNTTSDYFNERIPIVPVFLNKTDNDAFNMKFFEEIFLNTNFLTVKDRIVDASDSNTMLASGLKSNILKLKQVNRIQLACNLILGDGPGVAGNFGCAIRGYTLYTHEKPRTSSHIYTKGEQYKVVQTESSIRVKETDEAVEIPDDNDLSYTDRKYQAGIRRGLEFKYKDAEGYKHDSIYLTDQQISFLKNFTFDHECNDDVKDEDEESSSHEDEENHVEVVLTKPPYLKLLGFRDISKYQPYYNVSAPVFITYDTSNGSNSQYGYSKSDETFKALYKSCVKLQKYAILFGCTKRNALPNMYALYPTNVAKSSKSEDFPQGFLLMRLPYLDDLRTLPTYMLQESYPRFNEGESTLPQELIDGYTQMIKALRIGEYKPSEFPNPSLNYLYEYMKSDLLGVETGSNSVESYDKAYTLVQDVYARLQKTELSSIIKSINNKLADFGGDQSAIEEPPKKKVKVEEVSEMQILRAWRDESLNQFNMNQLKAFVAKYKTQIKSATKKADLINNISDYLHSRQSKY